MTLCSCKDGPDDVGNSSGRGLGIRHVQVVVMAIATFIAAIMCGNLNVAIVSLVDVRNDTEVTDAVTFDWDERIQGYVLSSFFWGYLISQVPAGILAGKFGGHRILCTAILASSFLTIILPQCAYIGGWRLICCNRMLLGLSQGFIYPSIYTLLGLWAPPSERSKFTSISLTVPWNEIFRSAPVLSAIFATAIQSALYVLFIAEIPTLFATVLQLNLQDNGFLSGLPFLVSWLLTFLCTWICDNLTNRGYVTTTAARKLFNSIAHFGAATFIILLAHADDRVSAIVFTTFAIGIQSAVFVGVISSFVDLTPNFTGTIFAVANLVSNIIGLCGPIIVGNVVTEKGSIPQWRYIFYGCSTLFVISNIVYLIWGSSETQWWNCPDEFKNNEEMKNERKRDQCEQTVL